MHPQHHPPSEVDRDTATEPLELDPGRAGDAFAVDADAHRCLSTVHAEPAGIDGEGHCITTEIRVTQRLRLTRRAAKFGLHAGQTHGFSRRELAEKCALADAREIGMRDDGERDDTLHGRDAVNTPWVQRGLVQRRRHRCGPYAR